MPRLCAHGGMYAILSIGRQFRIFSILILTAVFLGYPRVFRGRISRLSISGHTPFTTSPTSSPRHLRSKTGRLRWKTVLDALSRQGEAQSVTLSPPSPDVAQNLASHGRFRRFARKALKPLRPGAPTRTLAANTLRISLETLKEASPAFPPLQGAVGGLLKLMSHYETMAQNTLDRQKLYDRIGVVKGSLEAACNILQNCAEDADERRQVPLTASLKALAESIQAIIDVLPPAHRQGRLKRFLLARDHRSQIMDLLARLSEVDDDFRRSLEIDTNGHVQSVTLRTDSHVNEVHSLGLEVSRRIDLIGSLALDINHRVGELELTLTRLTVNANRRASLKPGAAIRFSALTLPSLNGLFAVARS
ncbi:unnamed protein product [Peniophora sp. CBMAI 1063]|nr:unnamed protein product [Peniophora sp. CBMAI 1063]